MIQAFSIGFVIIFGILFVFGSAQFAEWSLKSPEQFPIKNKRISGEEFHLTVDSPTRLVVTCFRECLKRLECSSFSYHHGRNQCELNTVSHENNSLLLKDAEGFDYYTRSSWFLEGQEDVVKEAKLSVSKSPSRLSTWGVWGSCSKTCGVGYKGRTRHCEDGICNGNLIEWEGCNGNPCEGGADMNWQHWGDWGPCSTRLSCGRGSSLRNRSCTTTSGCSGLGSQTKICGSMSCNAYPMIFGGENLAEGIVHIYDDSTKTYGKVCADGWDDTDASVTCRQMGFTGGVTREFSAYNDTDHPFIVSNLICDGSEAQITDCKHDGWYDVESCSGSAAILCSVSGLWGPWSSWTNCSVSCSTGTRSRSRVCDSPPPLNGGRKCDGDEDEYQEDEPCLMEPCSFDGVYEAWLDWGACSVSCAGGTQIRSRPCIQPQYGGDSCDVLGPAEESRSCNEDACPVDGVWGVWTAWTGCVIPDSDCGDGTISRSRECDGPYYGGEDCPGEAEESEPCFIPCKIPGEWLEWGPWGKCSKTCDDGVRSRERNCNMTTHGENTIACVGEGSITDSCNSFGCTPAARSCAEWKSRGLVDSAKVEIKLPSYYNPIWAYCDLELMDGVGVTVFNHDKMERTHVTGKEAAYAITLQYESFSSNQFDAVTDAINMDFGKCRQYLKWECLSATINSPNQLAEGLAITYWRNRFQDTMHYWGGVPENDALLAMDGMICPCGLDNSCYNHTSRCNCDANDDKLRVDEGYLSLSIDLPISQIVVGDTGADNEEGYYTAGPLECTDP